jgi:sulfotransferase family protein
MRRRSGLGRTGRIFGIGLSRTGTTSLTSALGQLGFRALHFPADEVSRAQVMNFIAEGGDALRLSILSDLDALTDTPVCATFDALDAAYPGSRFILTVRDRQGWLESCRHYWTTGVEPFMRDHRDMRWTVYLEALSIKLYGGAHFDPERFSAAYEAYHERVRMHFRDRESDLLTLDICKGDGWEPLCGFLNLRTPGVEFPWEYARREDQQ